METVNQIVYKKDSKGKIRFCNISTEGDQVIQQAGLVGGNPTKHSSSCIGKNIGKSNETTPEEQAIVEAKAKVKKKLDEGYFDSIEKAENEVVILPMLAKEYSKEKHKIDWTTAYCQPKLDGMRCLKNNGGMVSRKNKPIDTLPHISSIQNPIMDMLDGELYAHGLSFQENMKLIKKQRPESVNVKYHVYDMVYPNLPFIERYNILSLFKHENIEVVPTYKVNSQEELDKYHQEFLSLGYEGTMLRWGNEGYKVNGRSSNLLKYKDFIDITVPVIFVKQSEKNPEQGVVVCELPGFPLEEGVFSCGMKFSHAEREEILTNKDKYIGQTAEIRFFEYTDSGLPRFPVCVGFRLDK